MLSWHFGGHLVHQFIEMFKFNSLLKCLYTIKLSITYLSKCCNSSLIAQFIANFIVLISNNYHISKYEFLTRSKRFSPRIGNFDQTCWQTGKTRDTDRGEKKDKIDKTKLADGYALFGIYLWRAALAHNIIIIYICFCDTLQSQVSLLRMHLWPLGRIM